MRTLIAVLLVFVAAGGCDSNPTAPTSDEQDPEGTGTFAADLATQNPSADGLSNGDMEEDQGWWFYGPNGSNQGYSTEASHSGQRSARISRSTTSGPGAFSYAGQYMPAQGLVGTKVTLTARIKLEGVSGNGAAIAIRGDTQAFPSGTAEIFATTQGTRSLVGTEDWFEVSVELDGFENDIESIAVYLILLSESAGTVYFDDVELSYSDWDPIRTLQNGGFEQSNVLPTHWWRGYTDKGFHFGFDGVEAYEGNRAVSISRDVSNPGEFAFWAQTIFSEDFHGRAATLKAMIKTDLVGQGVSIAIRGDDTFRPSGSSEVFATTQGVQSITGTSDWEEVSVTLDHVPPTINSLTVYLIFLPETTGTVLFDQVGLTR